MLRTVYSVLLLLIATAAQAEYTKKTESGVEFQVGGRVVLQYKEYRHYDYEMEDDAFDMVEGDDAITQQDDALALVEADAQYRVRRFRPSMRIRYEDWQANLSWELAGGRRNVKNAYVRYRGIDWLDVRLGNEVVPFSRERMTSSGRQHAPERALTGSTEFGVPGRQPGIHLKTRFDYPVNLHLSYADANIHGDVLTEIQFINPWGSSSVDDSLQDEGTMTVARVDYNIFGKVRYREGHLKGKPGLNLSMAVMDWDNKDTVVEIEHVEGWETALAYRGYGLSVDLQYQQVTATSPFTIERRLFDDGKARVKTLSLEAGYFVIDKKLEVFASYQSMATKEWEKDWRVYELGGTYMFDKHDHKLQFAFRRDNARKGHDFDRDTFYVQWQLNF